MYFVLSYSYIYSIGLIKVKTYMPADIISAQQNASSQYLSQNTQLDWLQFILISLFFYFIAITIKYLIFVFWSIVKWILPATDLIKRYSSERQQTWAVVTGATTGIGLGFCQQLVLRGFNLCLIDRNAEKLNKVISRLEQIGPPQQKCKHIKGIEFDFTQSIKEQKFIDLWNQIDKLNIGIFVNSVGITLVKSYESIEFKDVVNLISTNCLTMACFNNRLISKMKSRKSKSAIINLASLAGINPIPFISLQSSTKAFSRFLSEGLSIEYPEIDILTITPMYVQNTSSNIKKQFNILESRECARHSLNQLKFQKFSSFGSLMHSITGEALMTFLPKWFLRIYSTAQMKKLIAKYYIKQE